jgi:hypothetical protein
MLDYKLQTRIVEEAHAGIGWILISHVNDHKAKGDYLRAAEKLEKAAGMLRKVVENAEPELSTVQGDGS